MNANRWERDPETVAREALERTNLLWGPAIAGRSGGPP
jgi:hypothetical protein